MKRLKRIIAVVLVILIAALGFFAVRYREYIKAYYYSKKYDTDTIAGLIEDNGKAYADVSKVLEDVEVRDLTPDEQTALEEGTLTEKEIEETIVTDKRPAKDSTPQGGSSAQETEDGQSETDYDKLIAQSVAQLYVLKSQYVNYLKSIEQSVIDDYNALPEENKNTAGKRQVILKYYEYGQTLEKQCDGKVEAILAELTEILEQAGRDKSLISSIRSAYNNEKTLQKSYYLSIYNS